MARAKNTSQKFYVYLDAEKYWEYLENGKDIDELYPESFKTDIVNIGYNEFMKTQLHPGEEYVLLDDKQHDYAITSFGRTFNCHSKNQVWTYVGKENASVIVRNKKIQLNDFFKQQGWKFDIKMVGKHTHKKRQYIFISMKPKKDKEVSVQKYALSRLKKMDKDKNINPRDKVFINFNKL